MVRKGDRAGWSGCCDATAHAEGVRRQVSPPGSAHPPCGCRIQQRHPRRGELPCRASLTLERARWVAGSWRFIAGACASGTHVHKLAGRSGRCPDRWDPALAGDSTLVEYQVVATIAGGPLRCKRITPVSGNRSAWTEDFPRRTYKPCEHSRASRPPTYRVPLTIAGLPKERDALAQGTGQRPSPKFRSCAPRAVRPKTG